MPGNEDSETSQYGVYTKDSVPHEDASVADAVASTEGNSSSSVLLGPLHQRNQMIYASTQCNAVGSAKHSTGSIIPGRGAEFWTHIRHVVGPE